MSAGLGGMIGSFIQSASSNLHEQRKYWRDRHDFIKDRGYNQVREDTALQRRVADAKAAGVHPLFALGASVGSSPSFFMPSGGSGYQGGGFSVSTPTDRRLESAVLRESEARARLVETQAEEADYILKSRKASDAARALQKSNVTQDIVKVPTPAEEFSVVPDVHSKARLFKERGAPWRTSRSAQAQKFEDHYGELSDWMYGPARFLHDWYWYNEGWRMFHPYGVQERVWRDERSGR